MTSLLTNLTRDWRAARLKGSVMIEAAIVLIPLIAIIFGTIELSLIFVERQSLESAAAEIAHTAVAEDDPDQPWSYYVAKAPIFLMAEDIDFQVSCFASLQDVVVGNEIIDEGGEPACTDWRYAKIKISTEYRPITPLIEQMIHIQRMSAWSLAAR